MKKFYDKWLNRFDKVSQALNRNTGFLVLVAIIIFGFAILNFQKDNRKVLEGIEKTTNNTENIAQDTQAILGKIDQSTENINKKSDRNARLTNCLLILHGHSTQINPEDETECQKAVDNANLNMDNEPIGVQIKPVPPKSQQSPNSPDPPPEQPQEPENPDNDDVIIDLPLLPEIRIGNPF